VNEQFRRSVLEVVASIGPGEVLTYGEVAAEAGHPGAARAVGTLMRTSDAPIPWWRVVGAGGRLRTPSPERQAELLRSEGHLVEGGVVRPPGRRSPPRAY
jgi:methylated-DNA-protein-cysteine methyltransferase-like protein